MYYAGVKNTVNTTIDGGSPVEIVITSPTKLVTQTAGGINLKTGTGIEPEIIKGTKESGVDRFESELVFGNGKGKGKGKEKGKRKDTGKGRGKRKDKGKGKGKGKRR
jgi:hypothetical protein